MRKLFFFLVLFLFCFSLSTIAVEINIQDNENVTGGNVTRYVLLDSSAPDFEEYNINVRWTEQVWYYQESANVSNQTGKDGLSYPLSYDGGYFFTNTSNMPETDTSTLYDGVWWSNSFPNGEYNSTFYVNYTIPSNPLSVKYNRLIGSCIGTQGDDDPTDIGCAKQNDIPSSCFSGSVFQVKYESVFAGHPGCCDKYDIMSYCFNGTDWETVRDDSDTYYAQISEEAVWWGKKSDYDVNITFGGDLIFNDYVYTSLDWWETGNFASTINNFDSESCSCTDCVKDGLSCYVPVNFKFNPQGFNLTYNLTSDLYILTAGGVFVPTTPAPIVDVVVEIKDLILGGGSVPEILEAWNPEVYTLLANEFHNLITGSDLENLFDNIYKVVILFSQYVFRAPASLVPGGGVFQ